MENKLKNTGGIIEEGESLSLKKVKELLKNLFSTVDYKSAKDDASNFIVDKSSLDLWGKELFLSTLQEIKAN